MIQLKNLHLIPWGIETEIFSSFPEDGTETRRYLGLPHDAVIILSSRALTPLDNRESILHTLKYLMVKTTKIHLVSIRYNVNEEYEKKLSHEIEKQGLEGFVTWLPEQSSKQEMARLYRTADIVISIPSSEGYGFTAFEALACGCPAIVTDLPVFRNDLVNDIHVLKIPSNDSDSLTTSIERLLVDIDLRQRLVKNGEDITRSMSSANRQAQIIELYDRAVELK